MICTNFNKLSTYPFIENITKMPNFSEYDNTYHGIYSKINTDFMIDPLIMGVTIGSGMMVSKFKKRDISFDSLDIFINKYFRNPNITLLRSFDDRYDLNNKMFDYCDFYENYTSYKFGILMGDNNFIEIGEDKDSYYLFVNSGMHKFSHQIIYNVNKNIEHFIKTKEKLSKHLNNYKPGSQKIKFKKSEYVNELREMANKKYLSYVNSANIFSYYNRLYISESIFSFLNEDFNENIFKDYIHDTITNDGDNYIYRKGCVKCNNDDEIYSPINMKDGVLKGVAYDVEKYNNSYSFGVGKMYSKNDCKNFTSLPEFKSCMTGINTSCISMKNIHRSPDVYKRSETISKFNMIKDHVLIKPVYNFVM